MFESFKSFNYTNYLKNNKLEQYEDIQNDYTIDNSITEDDIKLMDLYLEDIIEDLFPNYKDKVTIIFVKGLKPYLGKYRSETESSPIILMNKKEHEKWFKKITPSVAYKSTIIHELAHALIDLISVTNPKYMFSFDDEEEFVETVAHEYLMYDNIINEIRVMVDELK